MNNEIKIQVPDGFEGIDVNKSDLSKGIIVFKKKESTSWRNNRDALLSGYYVNSEANIESVERLFNVSNAWNVFATMKQAQSMLAMARLSQIILNDKRFGGPITDDEWPDFEIRKYVISRINNTIEVDDWCRCYFRFLAFHTREQRDLFLEENRDLIKQYFMLD